MYALPSDAISYITVMMNVQFQWQTCVDNSD